MRKPSIALRLLWKEWSRGWPLLAGGILLAQAAMPLVARGVTIFKLDIAQAVLFVLALALVVRGATLAADERDRRAYAGTHFPFHPARGTLFTFGFHLLAAMVIGLGFGWYFALHTDPTIGTLLVLFCATIYLVSFIAALALSTPAGIVAGLLWTLIAGTAPFYAVTPPGGQQVLTDDFSVSWYSIYFVVVIVLALPALLPLLTKRVNVSLTRRIVGTVLLATAIALVPVAWYLQSQVNYYATDGTISERLTSPDGALTVKYTITLAGKNRSTALEFLDYRRQRAARLQLPAAVIPVGLVEDTAVILVTQQPGKRRIAFQRWDVERNSRATLLAIPARRDALRTVASQMYTYGFEQRPISLSSDGRFGLLILPTCFGLANRYDLWLIDFNRRQANILRAGDYSYSLQVTWQADHALLAGGQQVDLAHHTISSFSLPIEEKP